jgi:tRNA 2-thiouridine synthesizing protein A
MTMTTPPEGCLPLDLSGKFCPEVVLAVADAVQPLDRGTRLLITSTDPLSSIDLPLFSLRAGHKLEKIDADSGVFRFLLTVDSA